MASGLAGIVVIIGWFYDGYICFPGGIGECPFDQFRLSIIYPVLLFSRSFLLVSLFLFFARDDVFKKWLWFALVWFGISVFFIALAPAYNHGLFSMMNPTKESVSLWMSVIFIPVSLGFLLWSSKHSKA